MSTILVAAIEAAGRPALRVVFTLAALLALLAGAFIYHRRHYLFDRDPAVEDDIPVVRSNRAEEVIFVWGGLTLVLLSMLYQLWFD
jgi:hypothetical protein